LGDITLLVNNAGIAVMKPYLDHSDVDVSRQLDVNLRGTHYLMSAVIPGMVQRKAGAVVNIASAAALHYTSPHAGYAASKLPSSRSHATSRSRWRAAASA
jgi:short-subunit dehydrogenase